ncbi:MAG: CoA transferase, partial [Deltaproteobacteria bacterium]|nr:CoA transferase [Deltaproteobacteria bacterium]
MNVFTTMPLSGYRVLDLTNGKGFLCGRILADLGADVIKIEKPGGDPERNVGPFYKEVSDPNRNLSWMFYNLNKRSIELDIETEEGRNIFTRLVRQSHFIIESFVPGYLKKLGLGYEKLCEINPGIIYTSITPYGSEGPYSKFKACDINCWGMGVMMSLCGDPDRAPVQISYPQAFLHGSLHGAAASMIAHYHWVRTGQG